MQVSYSISVPFMPSYLCNLKSSMTLYTHSRIYEDLEFVVQYTVEQTESEINVVFLGGIGIMLMMGRLAVFQSLIFS